MGGWTDGSQQQFEFSDFIFVLHPVVSTPDPVHEAQLHAITHKSGSK